MKKTIFLYCILCMTSLSFAQVGNETKGRNIDSKIEQVTVFLKGAQVHRTASTQLTSGKNELIFKGISPNINKQSIQVKGDGQFTILSVAHQLNFLEEQANRTEIETLKTEQTNLSEKIGLLNNEMSVLDQEEQILLKNQLVGGANNGLKANDLDAMLKLQEEKFTAIRREKTILAKKMKEEQEKISKINNQLAALNQKKNLSTSDIIVSIAANTATPAKFDITYLVNEASWNALYDLRVKDVNNPIHLNYKANVSQSSGEDWKDVKVILSNGEPNKSGTKPNLEPWYLVYQNNAYANGITIRGSRDDASTVYIDGQLTKEEALEQKATGKSGSIALETSFKESQTTISFEIKIPYTILNDGKTYTVEVTEYDIPATYTYYATPKLDEDVFLTTQITNWESLNLLAGKAALFFEGTYLGDTYLNTNNVKDTLDISLGRDKNIVVKRTKLKEFSKKQFIGNNKTEERAFDITVRNKKQQSINLIIEDQFPISTMKEIEVEQLEHKDAIINKETGKIQWKLNLEPNKEKKFSFKYSIKYPKAKSLYIE